MREDHSIIRRDACHHPTTWNMCLTGHGPQDIHQLTSCRECELRADQVHDREARQWFLELARQWHHMADQWADLLLECGR
jgi:hypothetical protein